MTSLYIKWRCIWAENQMQLYEWPSLCKVRMFVYVSMCVLLLLLLMLLRHRLHLKCKRIECVSSQSPMLIVLYCKQSLHLGLPLTLSPSPFFTLFAQRVLKCLDPLWATSCSNSHTNIQTHTHTHTYTCKHAANWINSQIKFFTSFAQLTWQPAASCCMYINMYVVCMSVCPSLPFKRSMKCKGYTSFSSMSDQRFTFPFAMRS